MKWTLVLVLSVLFLPGLAEAKSGNISPEKRYSGEAAPAKEDVADSVGIMFTAGSWADIVKLAKQEKRMIFVDCYTVWCGPCKVLARTVFKDAKVAALMNKKFINVQVDMEKGEGITLKEKFGVKAFPTLLFISPSGEEEHRIVGSVPVDKFIGEAKIALAGEGLSAYDRKYKSGNRDTLFLKRYIGLLADSYKLDEAADIAGQYLTLVGPEKLIQKDQWGIFKEHFNNPHSPVFSYFFNNRQKFVERYGEKEVEAKLNRVWQTYANSFIKKGSSGFEFDQKGFDSYLVYLKSKGVQNINRIEFYTLLNANFAMEKWGKVADLIDAGIKEIKGSYSLMLLYNWTLKVSQRCSDTAVRKRAIAWVNLGIDMAEGEPDGSMYISAFKKVNESLMNTKK